MWRRDFRRLPDARRARAPIADDAGAAAVEFAIISLLLFALVFGIIQYGLLLFQLQSAQHAVTEGAALVRTARGGPCDAWRRSVLQLGPNLDGRSDPNADQARAFWTPDGTGPVTRDSTVQVSVVWSPVQIVGGLIPLPGTGPRATSVTSTVEHLGIGPEYTAGTGCPDPGP
jgi:hypothetical protein